MNTFADSGMTAHDLYLREHTSIQPDDETDDDAIPIRKKRRFDQVDNTNTDDEVEEEYDGNEEEEEENREQEDIEDNDVKASVPSNTSASAMSSSSSSASAADTVANGSHTMKDKLSKRVGNIDNYMRALNRILFAIQDPSTPGGLLRCILNVLIRAWNDRDTIDDLWKLMKSSVSVHTNSIVLKVRTRQNRMRLLELQANPSQPHNCPVTLITAYLAAIQKNTRACFWFIPKAHKSDRIYGYLEDKIPYCVWERITTPVMAVDNKPAPFLLSVDVSQNVKRLKEDTKATTAAIIGSACVPISDNHLLFEQSVSIPENINHNQRSPTDSCSNCSVSNNNNNNTTTNNNNDLLLPPVHVPSTYELQHWTRASFEAAIESAIDVAQIPGMTSNMARMVADVAIRSSVRTFDRLLHSAPVQAYVKTLSK